MQRSLEQVLPYLERDMHSALRGMSQAVQHILLFTMKPYTDLRFADSPFFESVSQFWWRFRCASHTLCEDPIVTENAKVIRKLTRICISRRITPYTPVIS